MEISFNVKGENFLKDMILQFIYTDSHLSTWIQPYEIFRKRTLINIASSLTDKVGKRSVVFDVQMHYI